MPLTYGLYLDAQGTVISHVIFDHCVLDGQNRECLYTIYSPECLPHKQLNCSQITGSEETTVQ